MTFSIMREPRDTIRDLIRHSSTCEVDWGIYTHIQAILVTLIESYEGLLTIH